MLKASASIVVRLSGCLTGAAGTVMAALPALKKHLHAHSQRYYCHHGAQMKLQKSSRHTDNADSDDSSAHKQIPCFLDKESQKNAKHL